jgi:hypothetical protein
VTGSSYLYDRVRALFTNPLYSQGTVFFHRSLCDIFVGYTKFIFRDSLFTAPKSTAFHELVYPGHLRQLLYVLQLDEYKLPDPGH